MRYIEVIREYKDNCFQELRIYYYYKAEFPPGDNDPGAPAEIEFDHVRILTGDEWQVIDKDSPEYSNIFWSQKWLENNSHIIIKEEAEKHRDNKTDQMELRRDESTTFIPLWWR